MPRKTYKHNNIFNVGYSHTTVAKEGQQLQSASFITIGQKDAEGHDCVRLSDLRVTGYETTFGFCLGSVWIDILDIDGSVPDIDGTPMSYVWMDYETDIPAGWYDLGGLPLKDSMSVLGNAEDITFACGEGICFNTKDGYEGCTFLCNGQVVEGQVQYIAAKEGQQIAGNPLCRTITLDELYVTGYEDTFTFCLGSVWIDILDIDGSVPDIDGTPMSYVWMDYETDIPAGWYDLGGLPLKDSMSVLGDATEIEFTAGEGICVNTKDGYEGCVLNFPQLKKAE